LIAAFYAVKLYMCWIESNKASSLHLLLWSFLQICLSCSQDQKPLAAWEPWQPEALAWRPQKLYWLLSCWIRCEIQPSPKGHNY